MLSVDQIHSRGSPELYRRRDSERAKDRQRLAVEKLHGAGAARFSFSSALFLSADALSLLVRKEVWPGKI